MSAAQIVGIALASTVALELIGCGGKIERAKAATWLRGRAQCLQYDALLNKTRAQVARTQYAMTHAGLGGLAPTDPPDPADCSRFEMR